MNLQYRLNLLERLGEYLLSEDARWEDAVQKAYLENGWFIPEFTQKAANAIATQFLRKETLQKWAGNYPLSDHSDPAANVGLILPGNIPLAGFHDLMSVFTSGHRAMIKLSTKDKVLLKHLADRICEWEPAAASWFTFSEMLKGCDAYIATGSNNSSRYFEFYFKKYPHIIRRNRTSVAILAGNETLAELEKLADDVFLYFGLGCRNVTKLYVPQGYDFLPLLAAFKKYSYLIDHHKYKNNYDYNLALHLLNKVEYMTNGSVLLVEEKPLFSPVSQVNFEFYHGLDPVKIALKDNPDLQCIVGRGFIPFGMAQNPVINEYADRVDTLEFLAGLTIRTENQ